MPRPGHFTTPWEGDLVPTAQAGQASGLDWSDAENFASQGFEPQTFQPIATCYTNYTTSDGLILPYCCLSNIKFHIFPLF